MKEQGSTYRISQMEMFHMEIWVPHLRVPDRPTKFTLVKQCF
jgi:hypothetical protein